MELKSYDVREKQIRKITVWGLVLNVSLVVFKAVSGFLIGSMALLADGVHSLSDMFTDFVVLIGTRLANRPADETHPYGHGKFETISTLVVSIVLLAVGIGFIWTAGMAVYRQKESFPGYFLLIAAGISVISKEILFFTTRKVAKRTESVALYANAWHHRSDSLSSVAVLIGGVASLFGYGHADQIATIVVGFMILGVAAKIFYEGLIELTEHAADEESIEAIEKVLTEEESIATWHALRTRKHGAELFVDVHILVEPELSVKDGHTIAHRIEAMIKKQLRKPVNILVHIEPEKEKKDNPDKIEG